MGMNKKILNPVTKITAWALGLTLIGTTATGTIKIDKEIKVPEYYKESTLDAISDNNDEIIKASQLEKITELTINVTDSCESLDFLKYCTSLEILNLIIDNQAFTILETLPKMNSTYAVRIFSSEKEDGIYIDSKNVKFLSKFPNLEILMIASNNIYLGKNTLEQYKNIKHIGLFNLYSTINYDVDFSKLTFLDSLTFDGCLPYHLPMYFSSEEYKILKEANVDVKLNFLEGTEKDYFEICDKLDDIIKELNITSKDASQEKINKIVCYVLENYNYDPEVQEAIKNNATTDDMTTAFYEKGLLAGLLKETQICGNYSSLVSALAKKLGLDEYLVFSDIHMWNMFDFSGMKAYVDTTLLDSIGSDWITLPTGEEVYLSPEEAIKKGLGYIYAWYMLDPSEAQKYSFDGAHEATNLPIINYVDEELLSILEQKETEEGKKFLTIVDKDMFNMLLAYGIINSLIINLVISVEKKNRIDKIKKYANSKLSYGEKEEIDKFIENLCSNSDSLNIAVCSVNQIIKGLYFINMDNRDYEKLCKDHNNREKSIYMLDNLLSNPTVIEALKNNNVFLNEIFDDENLETLKFLRFINNKNQECLIKPETSTKHTAKRKLKSN